MSDLITKTIFIYLKVEDFVLGFGEDSNEISTLSSTINNNPLDKTIILHGTIYDSNPFANLSYKIKNKDDEYIIEKSSFNGFHFQLNIYGKDKKKKDSLGSIQFTDSTAIATEIGYDKFFFITCFYEKSTFNELYSRLITDPKFTQEIRVEVNYNVDRESPTLGLSVDPHLDFIENDRLQISNVRFLYKYKY